MKSSISVIIPTWKRKDLLRLCLLSLREQTRPPDEIIVVDNASGDGTLEMLDSEFPGVAALALEHNEGFSRAVNRGIAAAGGGLIALLNNDTECDPRWLETLAAAAAANPGYDFFASRVVYHDRPDTLDSAGDLYTPWGMALNRGHGEPAAGEYLRETEVFGACAAAAMYRADALRRAGGFEENFFAYYEDIEWSFRARLMGSRCLYVPGAVVRHRWGGSSPLGSKLGREEVFIHLTAVVVKLMPLPLVIRNFLPLAAFHSVVFFFFLVARVRGRRALPRVRLLRLFAAMLRGRRRIRPLIRPDLKDVENVMEKLSFTAWLRSELAALRGGGK